MAYNNERPINLVKQIALDLLPSVMSKLDVEDNEENREDILALALNKLPVKYVTSGSGKLYSEMIENFIVQYKTDVLMGLTRATLQVKNKPRGTVKTEGK